MIRRFNGDALLALDLRAYNSGRNPYSDADSSLDNAFQRGVDHYRNYVQERVKARGNARVLDLLCGFGRWIPFLAECNDEVIGVEALRGCTRIAEGVCRDLGLDNVDIRTGDVSLTESFADGYFDFVWIWSGLQYVHRGRALAEVYRILKPGGRVFVGAYNGPGLMLDHVIEGATGTGLNTGSSQWALSALVEGEMWSGNPNFISPEGAEVLLPVFGFEEVVATDEGGISMVNDGGVRRGFKGRKTDLGLTRTMEFIARKPDSPQPGGGRERFIALLRGDPGEQAMARIMLREEGPFPGAVLVDLLGHDDAYVQQNVRQGLVARGDGAVAVLLAALVSDDNRASFNGALGLTEVGSAAVGGLLSGYRREARGEKRERIAEVIGEILDTEGSVILDLAKLTGGGRLSSPRLLLHIFASLVRRILGSVYRRFSARMRRAPD